MYLRQTRLLFHSTVTTVRLQLSPAIVFRHKKKKKQKMGAVLYGCSSLASRTSSPIGTRPAMSKSPSSDIVRKALAVAKSSVHTEAA